MAKKNIADKYWIYGEDAELAARLTSYLTRVVYNQRANYIRALMKIKEHECSIEDCDSDIESQSMRSGNSLEESIESKLMWEAIRKYLPKLELKECEVMIALYFLAEQKQKYLLLTQPIHTKCGRLLLRTILNHAIHDGII